MDIESVLSSPTELNPEYRIYKRLYGDGDSITGEVCNLFGACWLVKDTNNTNNYNRIKQRVDMFVSSQEGYINRTFVTYKNTGFKEHINSTFEEEFIQYSFDGETISSDEEGEEIETIVGSRRAQKKIIIRYIEQKST